MIDQVKKVHIGIVRTLGEDDASILEAGEIFGYIKDNLAHSHHPVDIFVDNAGVWHLGGLPVIPTDLIHRVDLIWCLEDPHIREICEKIGIPHISINPFAYVLDKNKSLLQEYMKSLEISMPRHLVLEAYQEDLDGNIDTYAIKKANEVFQKFGAPWIIKTRTNEKNEGIHVIKTFPELIDIISDFAEKKKNILIEELISGKKISTHSVGGFRGQDVYHFGPMNLSKKEKDEIHRLSLLLWKHLEAKHYLNLNFILHPRKLYLDSISFSVDFKKGNNLRDILREFGFKMHDVIEHILGHAILKK